MSEPINPLSEFNAYNVRHILAAFATTTSAESTVLKKESGSAGEAVGDGFIIVNELEDFKFRIKSLVWEWRKHGYTGLSTTSMDGYIDITDHTGGYFLDWFEKNVRLKLQISTEQMTFALKTFFIGINRNGEPVPKVIQAEPLICRVHNISDTMNNKKVGTTIRLYFSAAYNTSAQSPTICKPYQMTLTHKDGQLNNVAPQVYGGSGGLKFRGIEDATLFPERKIRLEKSKPMKTLKDVFDALESSLNQQAFVHQRQVQDWLALIRPDYIKKIEVPEQERGDLPIKFKVRLDPIYSNYEIDNRNLPFEQEDEKVENPGVTAIPFRAGASIVEMVDTIMRYSSQVGIDVDDDFIYKTNISCSRTSETLNINIKVKRITLPYNTTGRNTGPGDGIVMGPLSFTFKAGDRSDTDIMYFTTNINSATGIVTLEDGEKKLPVYGNREPITAERIPENASGTQYFKSEYSGLRMPIIPYLNTSVEDPVASAKIDSALLISSDQASNHQLEIRGNPYLMSDLQRKPSDAAELDSPGSAKLYKIPESYPMYLKVDIFMKTDSALGLEAIKGINQKYFYTNWYEITGVTNNLTNGKFIQTINLDKTDNII